MMDALHMIPTEFTAPERKLRRGEKPDVKEKKRSPRGRAGMRVYMTVSTTTARAVLPVTGFEAR